MIAAASVHGVLTVDKPSARSSHQVVALARRAFGTRAVGHGGTLDPLATGLLVLGIGEGTKLLGYVSDDSKEYQAHLRLGVATDTLDADGEPVSTGPLPALEDRTQLEQAVAALTGEQLQVPPVISAIKKDGVPMYRRARRGEAPEPEPRRVTLHAFAATVLGPDLLELTLHCSKGYYVRSLGRDLALALGTVGHLAKLRRVRSGSFSLATAVECALLERAAAGDAGARAELREHVVPMSRALAHLPRLVLDADGCRDAHHGRVVSPERCKDGVWPAPGVGPVALLSEDEELIALGRGAEHGVEIVRGFRYAS